MSSSDSLAQQQTNALRAKVDLAEKQEFLKKLENDVLADAARIDLEETMERKTIAFHDPLPGIAAHILAATDLAVNAIRESTAFGVSKTQETVGDLSTAAASAAAATTELAHEGLEKTKETAAAVKDTTVEASSAAWEKTKETAFAAKDSTISAAHTAGDAISNTASAAWEKTKDGAEFIKDKTVAAAVVTKDTTVHAAHVAGDAITNTASATWEKTKDAAAAVNDAANGNIRRDATESASANLDAATARMELEAAIDRERSIESMPMNELPLAAKLKSAAAATGDAIAHAAGQAWEATKEAAEVVSRKINHTEIQQEDKALRNSFSGRFDTTTPVLSHITA